MASFLTLFVGLLATGMPVFLVLGLCAGAMFMASGQPLVGAAQLVINELNSPTLMALPLFVMAAAFMRFGGIANALVNLAAAWLGGLLPLWLLLRRGLGMDNGPVTLAKAAVTRRFSVMTLTVFTRSRISSLVLTTTCWSRSPIDTASARALTLARPREMVREIHVAAALESTNMIAAAEIRMLRAEAY